MVTVVLQEINCGFNIIAIPWIFKKVSNSSDHKTSNQCELFTNSYIFLLEISFNQDMTVPFLNQKKKDFFTTVCSNQIFYISGDSDLEMPTMILSTIVDVAMMRKSYQKTSGSFLRFRNNLMRTGFNIMYDLCTGPSFKMLNSLI